MRSRVKKSSPAILQLAFKGPERHGHTALVYLRLPCVKDALDHYAMFHDHPMILRRVVWERIRGHWVATEKAGANV